MLPLTACLLVGLLAGTHSQSHAQAQAQIQTQAAGDAARGVLVWEEHCTDCHAAADNGVGPRHAAVFGRRAGTVPGFTYSAALKKSGIVWTAGPLDRWLRDPEAYIPGQKMDYSLRDEQARADVIAYLIKLKTAN